MDRVAVGAPTQLGPARLVGLFLAPGAAITAAFVVLAPVVDGLGFPPLAALLIAIAAVLVPLELGLVLRAGRGTGSALGAIAYRERVARSRWLWLVPALIVAAFLGFGLHQAIEPALISGLFGWLPEWFVAPIDFDQIDKYAAGAWIVTLAGYFILNGLVGPVVEELYFRGYLLPRMEWLGRWAPLVNVTLFSLYHFWSPWQLVARIVGFGPTAYAVRWTRNVSIGIVVHCTLNVISVVLVAAAVMGRL